MTCPVALTTADCSTTTREESGAAGSTITGKLNSIGFASVVPAPRSEELKSVPVLSFAARPSLTGPRGVRFRRRDDLAAAGLHAVDQALGEADSLGR